MSKQKIHKRLALAGFACFFAYGPVFGANEYWVPHYGSDRPFATAIDAVAFKDNIFALSIGAQGFVWSSGDGVVWRQIRTLSGLPPFRILVHDNHLIQISQGFTAGGYDYVIFKSPDGWAWPKIKQGSSSSRLMNAVSSGGYLYIVWDDGTFERTNANGATPVWETLPSFPRSNNQFISLIDFDGVIHASRTSGDAFSQSMEVFRFKNNSWELVSQAGMVGSLVTTAKPRLCVFNGELFLSYIDKSWKTSGGVPAPYSWTELSALSGTPHVVYPLFDQLHAFTTDDSVKILNSAGAWEVTTSDRLTHILSGQIGSRTFVFSGFYIGGSGDGHVLWTLDRGVMDVKYSAPPSATFYAGQKSNTVLGMSIKANLGDNLTITVKNLGTAAQGASIDSVRLVRSVAGQPPSASNTATLAVDPSNDRRWTLNTPLPVQDGDQVFVVIDVNEKPVDNDSCVFVVESLSFTENPAYSPASPIVSNQSQTIRNISVAGQAASIDEAVIFPNPARDVVHFMYDLGVSSDVEIRLFNEEGSLVSEVSDLNKTAGRQETVWNASGKAPGVYLASIKIKGSDGSNRLYKRKVYLKR